MTRVTLHEGDNRLTLRRPIDQGVRVHSVVTDPPYGLTSVTKRFGKEGAAPAKFGTDGAFSRASGGFMGQVWDGTGIERDPEFWRLIWEILLPGGFVFAFSGSRTGHWQACAMETAGFIMHPMHGWAYGSGMPKAHNPCPAIDKHMGVEGDRDLLGETVRRMRSGADQNNDGTWEKLEDREYERGTYVPGSPEAQQWDGWRHGTQTQKPALEPIYLGQKPFSEKNGALNLLKHGVGALNIDGCRVPTADDLNGGAYAAMGGRSESPSLRAGSGMNVPGKTVGTEFVQPLGRWPANLIHDGSAEVVALFPDSGGSGPARTLKRSGGNRDDAEDFGFNAAASDEAALRDAGSGSAARFFNSFPPDTENVDITWTSDHGEHQVRLLVDTGQSPQKVIAASGSAESSDWNTFLFGKPITETFHRASKFTTETRTNSTTTSPIWNFLTRLLTSDCTESVKSSPEIGGNLVANVASNSTLTITMSERTEFLLGANPAASGTQLRISVLDGLHVNPILYHAKATKSDRAGSVHPTVKPIGLMEHLIRHVTPPGGIVLDPFAGSGTTAEAARRLGFDCVLMEAQPEYAGFLRERFDLPSAGIPADLYELFGTPPYGRHDDLRELFG